MRFAKMLFLYSAMGETICKFNGIRRRRNIREIETDYIEESELKELNIFLLRIEGSEITRLSEFTSDKLEIVSDENENYETLVTVSNPEETQYLCCDESIVHVDMIQACQLLDFRKQQISSDNEENLLQDDVPIVETSENASNTTHSENFTMLNVLKSIQSSFTTLYGLPGITILLIGLLFGALLVLLIFLCTKFCKRDDRDPEISNEQINSLLLKSSAGSTGTFDFRRSVAETFDGRDTLSV